MQKKSWKTLLYSLFILFFSIFLSCSVFAHDVLPDEIVNYIEENPNATQEEIGIFFEKTFGYSLQQFWEENPDPADSLFEDSQEYIDMQLAEKKYLSSADITAEDLSRTLLQKNEKFKNIPPSSQELFLQRALSLRNQSTPDSFLEALKFYIHIGIRHILEGIDHILFILSLLCLLLPFRKILVLISIFTLSHSITLLLAGMNIFIISSRIVEPVIAFSIAFTALSSLSFFQKKFSLLKNFKYNVGIVFLFGLFHGLGFAGSFSALNISSENYFFPLLSLNTGVEIGQLFIIGFAFPIIWFLRKHKTSEIFFSIFVISISLLALFWVWERIFI